MYRQHGLREIGLRRGVSRDKNGLRRGLAGLNRTWTFDPCTPCLKFCTPTFKILPNSLRSRPSRLAGTDPSNSDGGVCVGVHAGACVRVHASVRA